MNLRIKVCGMRNVENITALGQLNINYMGLIFYEKSPRYVKQMSQEDISQMHAAMRGSKERVGVFVNADLDTILEKANKYGLDLIQLHGNESPEFCRELNKTLPIIKAFSISEPVDFEATKDYQDLWGYLLFDTKTPQYGGSGQKFDWNILQEYKGQMPFFLSGGISEDDVEAIRKINHPKLDALDLNSKFEIEPALKDIQKLEKFINKIKQ